HPAARRARHARGQRVLAAVRPARGPVRGARTRLRHPWGRHRDVADDALLARGYPPGPARGFPVRCRGLGPGGARVARPRQDPARLAQRRSQSAGRHRQCARGHRRKGGGQRRACPARFRRTDRRHRRLRPLAPCGPAVTQDLARIRAFVQVFDAGGFSAAARQHGRSKALLSKYVTDLEDYLGVRLMNRTTRKLSLTEAGESYYREASQLLQQLDVLDATISDQTAEPRGLIRVSGPRNFGETTLAPALFAFLVDNPMVTIDLRLEDRFVDLVDEGIDVALRVSLLPDSSLIARRISDMHVVAGASPELLKRVGDPKHPEDLRHLPCIIDVNLQGQS